MFQDNGTETIVQVDTGCRSRQALGSWWCRCWSGEKKRPLQKPGGVCVSIGRARSEIVKPDAVMYVLTVALRIAHSLWQPPTAAGAQRQRDILGVAVLAERAIAGGSRAAASSKIFRSPGCTAEDTQCSSGPRAMHNHLRNVAILALARRIVTIACRRASSPPESAAADCWSGDRACT